MSTLYPCCRHCQGGHLTRITATVIAAHQFPCPEKGCPGAKPSSPAGEA